MIIYEGTNNLVSGAFLKYFSIYTINPDPKGYTFCHTVQPAKCLYRSHLQMWKFESHMTFFRG